MTVTLVFANGSDGYLLSNNANYEVARSGGSFATSVGGTGYIGQNNNGGTYSQLETFISFTWAAMPTSETCASAVIRVRSLAMLSASVARHLEIRSASWTAGGLTSADWQDPTELAASTLYGEVRNINAMGIPDETEAGSDALRLYVDANNTSLQLVLVTDRQRAGVIPLSDEALAIYTGNTSGTHSDPCLIFTTTLDADLMGGHGAAAQLSDQSWVYLKRVTGTQRLRHITDAGVVTDIQDLSNGGSLTDFSVATSAQSYALCVDESDNIYVFGRSGGNQNAIVARAWTKGVGHTWTAQPARSAALPTHDTPVNNVTATYHESVNGGTILLMVAHNAGTNYGTGSTPAQIDWVTFAKDSLLLGTGTVPLATGPADLLNSNSPDGYYGGALNDTGTGLEVAASRDATPYGFMLSFAREQSLGENWPQRIGRYALNATGTGMDLGTHRSARGYATKDANAKLRVLTMPGNLLAVVTTDVDPGWGLSYWVGSWAGGASTELGYVALSGDEPSASLPDGPAFISNSAWDVLFNATENRLWIYYVSALDATQVMRTSISMDTYLPNNDEVVVTTLAPATTIHAIRVPRNAVTTDRTHVSIYSTGGTAGTTEFIDTFNMIPTAPTLTTRDGFDAELAALFEWTFNDPNPGDTQSAFTLEIEDVAAPGVVVYTTADPLVSGISAHILPDDSLVNGNDYQWRVQTRDADGEISPWSDWGLFTTAAGGSVTITSPLVDNAPGIETSEYQISWEADGTDQTAYRVWLYRGGDEISDSGWVISTDDTYLLEGLVSDVEHEVEVRVRNAAMVVSNEGTRLITPSYATPETPVITATAVPDSGYIRVSVDNPAPGEPDSGNPEYGFEPGMDLTGWDDDGAVLDLSVLQAYQGVGSGRVVAAGGVPAYVRAPLETVVPGSRYTVRVWIYSASPVIVGAAIDWQDAGAVYLSTTASPTLVPADTWTLITATGTAPELAASAVYGITLEAVTPTAGDTVFIDDVLFATASDRPEVTVNEVFRKLASAADTAWELIGECDADGEYHDFEASSGVTYSYKVRGQA